MRNFVLSILVAVPAIVALSINSLSALAQEREFKDCKLGYPGKIEIFAKKRYKNPFVVKGRVHTCWLSTQTTQVRLETPTGQVIWAGLVNIEGIDHFDEIIPFETQMIDVGAYSGKAIFIMIEATEQAAPEKLGIFKQEILIVR